MAKDLAIVLNNGSVASAVTAAMAAQRCRLVMVHVETAAGATRSRAAYDLQVAHFKPYREHTLNMSFLGPLQNEKAVNNLIAADPRQGVLGKKLLELTPLIGSAVRFAAHYQAACVYVGARVGPQSDELAQATEYFQIWNELMQLGCGLGNDAEVMTPLLELDLWQVVDVGFSVAAPLERTWSCHEETPEPCWACRGCRERETAFQQAAKPDPTRVVRKV